MADLSLLICRAGLACFWVEHSENRDAVLYCTLSGTRLRNPASELGRSRSNCQNIVLYLREPESDGSLRKGLYFVSRARLRLTETC
jgi:hypothetical protein